MSDEMDFFIFLLEQYAAAKGRNASDVLREWDEKSVTQEIYGSYWGYHTESLENAYTDIDSMVATGTHAW